MEQDLRDEGAARARHVVHVLPQTDIRAIDMVRTLVERLASGEESPEPGVRLLILAPTPREAALCAAHVNAGLDASSPLVIPVVDTTRGPRRLASAAAAVTTPEVAGALVKQSLLKLDALTAVVLLQLDELLVHAGAAVETLIGECPRGVDKAATVLSMTPAVEHFLESHARKARRMTYDAPASEASDATLEYVVVDPSLRTQALDQLLSQANPDHATVIASEDDAELACASLAQLGYGPEDALVSFSDGECPEGEPLVVLYTAPADPGDLAEVVTSEPARIVALVAPEEAAAFRRAFGRGARPALLPAALPAATSAATQTLDAIRQELATGHLHHHLVTLAPLFAEFDAAEVAAAVLRRAELQATAPQAVASSSGAMASAPGAAVPARRPVARAAAAPATHQGSTGEFTSLFITIGEKDGARKGDLVGAIANEAGIDSAMLGKITMRDTFSVVEVDSSVAARVIETLNGKTIRGRVASVREDRGPREGGSDRPRRPSTGFGGGARGGDRPRRSFRDDGPPSRGFSGPRSRGGPDSREGRDSRGGRDAGDRPRRSSRDDVGGPRTFRDGDRGRRPRAMDESRDWRERGERLRNTRRPRRGDD